MSQEKMMEKIVYLEQMLYQMSEEWLEESLSLPENVQSWWDEKQRQNEERLHYERVSLAQCIKKMADAGNLYKVDPADIRRLAELTLAA